MDSVTTGLNALNTWAQSNLPTYENNSAVQLVRTKMLPLLVNSTYQLTPVQEWLDKSTFTAIQSELSELYPKKMQALFSAVKAVNAALVDCKFRVFASEVKEYIGCFPRDRYSIQVRVALPTGEPDTLSTGCAIPCFCFEERNLVEVHVGAHTVE